MIGFSFPGKEKAVDQRVLLLLQADKAYWFNVVDAHIEALHCQTIESTGLAPESQPSWLASAENRQGLKVELILDTVMDEVDIIAVEQSPHALINRYRQWVTLHRLRKDYPLASVTPIKEDYTDKVASLMHPVIPDSWSSWLFDLQSHGVVFTHVVTGTQILESWARKFDEKTVLVMPVAGYQRHVLIDKHAILALRTTRLHVQRAQGMAFDQFVLLQTIEQIEPALLNKNQPLNVVVPATNSLRIGQSDSGEHTSMSTTNLEDSSEADSLNKLCSADNNYLMAIYLNAPLSTTKLLLQDSQLIDSDSQALLATTTSISTISSKPPWYRVNSLLQRYLRSFKAVSMMRPIRQSFAWRLPEFQCSVAYSRACRHERLLSVVSVVFALAAAIAMLWAAHKLIPGRQIVQQQTDKRQALEHEYDQLLLSSAAVHDDPTAAALALRMSDQLDSGYGMPAEAILANVGTVLTSMPSIVLGSLIWVSTEPGDNYESLNYILSAVPKRRSAELADEAVVQVEMAGLVSTDTLNSQKREFDQFIRALEATADLEPVKVLESPVDRALSSEEGSAASGHFRLSFKMRPVK